ncbi:MAG TPA: hypothetical protein VG733_05480 [Chthoniobacteraceae bacterium]|nr:hypothetical protein [Chthoniobacteraceae bacterium]
MRLAFIFALAFAYSLYAADPAENYPDKSLGVSEVKITSFTDWAAKLHAYSGKTVVLPDGVTAALSKAPAADALFGGKSIGRTEKPGQKSEPLKLSELVNMEEILLKLKCRYDSGKDAFILSFPWETNDNRTNAELLKILTGTKPGNHDGKPDAWSEAFDGITGKPGNRATAWIVRWLGEEAGGCVTNRFAGNLLDGAGQPHLLILNDHVEMLPGEVYVSYYLFNRDGKIEEGGVMTAGGTDNGSTYPDRGVLNDAGNRMTYIGFEFKVEKSHLVLVSKPADDPNHAGETVIALDAAGASPK